MAMSEGEIVIKFECPKCGPTVLELPDDPTDQDHAKCKKCGADFGPYGKIKKDAMKAAKAEMQAALRKSFKGLKGWKLK
jgi:predicted RNA-binding Zn-ribbon protein involved in translation (DUF1610 family)